jgi:hypothetical protein
MSASPQIFFVVLIESIRLRLSIAIGYARMYGIIIRYTLSELWELGDKRIKRVGRFDACHVHDGQRDVLQFRKLGNAAFVRQSDRQMNEISAGRSDLYPARFRWEAWRKPPCQSAFKALGMTHRRCPMKNLLIQISHKGNA